MAGRHRGLPLLKSGFQSPNSRPPLQAVLASHPGVPLPHRRDEERLGLPPGDSPPEGDHAPEEGSAEWSGQVQGDG